MKKIYQNLSMVLFGITLLALSCKQDEIKPLEGNTTPPGQVSNVSISNGPGNATISYALPKDKDLLYVKAVYTLANGRQMEVKSSYYNNSLLAEGFGDTLEHEIKLYAVNRSETESAPTIIKVKPLENPIEGVFRSLKALPDFAAINVKAINPNKTELAIEILTFKDGKYVPTTKNINTAAPDIDQSIRGLDTIPQKFGITIRDRWFNYSDTLYTTIKPFFETFLPKSGYKEVRLPTDAPQIYNGTGVANMWDGNTMDWPSLCMVQNKDGSPTYVSFDLGKLANLSRIVIWNYPDYTNSGTRLYYNGYGIRVFEVWGTDNPPADGSFNNWQVIGSFTMKKPSGSPNGVQTPEDYAFANAGISFNFLAGIKKVRYLRIKSLSNWINGPEMAISEIQVYGDPR